MYKNATKSKTLTPTDPISEGLASKRVRDGVKNTTNGIKDKSSLGRRDLKGLNNGFQVNTKGKIACPKSDLGFMFRLWKLALWLVIGSDRMALYVGVCKLERLMMSLRMMILHRILPLVLWERRKEGRPKHLKIFSFIKYSRSGYVIINLKK